MYDKVRYFEDINYFKDFENEFPAIVYKDALTSEPEVYLNLCPFVQNAKLNSKFVNNMLPDGAIHTEVNSTEVQKSSNNHPESPQSFKSTINIADNFQLDNRSTLRNAGGQNRDGNVNLGQAKPIMCYNCKGNGAHSTRMSTTKASLGFILDYSKTSMLAYKCLENCVLSDEEQLLFLAAENRLSDLSFKLEGNLKVSTRSSVKTKVLAPGMYAIDVKPIPHPLKNNRSAHLTYINHLKESVETVREIVEEARVVKPLDNALNYVDNTLRVNTSTEASGSKPRSNTKKNRILPAKTENKKKVEDHPRTNKSVWTKVNRVDSSISSKRVVINSNSESVCKTCNKCLNSASHEMCVVNILNSVNATPTVKIVLNKGKQIWKPKGKLSDNSLNKTKQVWKATGKLFANVGYQWRSTGKKVALGKLNCGYQWRPTGKKFALGELCPLTKLSVQCCSKHMTGNRSKLKNFVEKFIGSVRFGNDHFGAIMGYGDYVIGDSVISRVYYVEGLGHNLFSVGQFCDSDLEVAFRKHSCFVRDINGADLLKGSRRTNLYTISIDDMMKSSLICLLSKASKSKSWLWHHRLNHLNFGTINDLARKDLVRGLPRLKFEKDHLCSACQLGKSKKFSHKPKSENTNMEVLHTLHMDLCGPMRVQSINGKKYILVIVDDYLRFTWVKFLRSKDETPEFVINFLKHPIF
ncbi:retrovirus-related pol polyprotein from transposon TNT 1-94 [Tanacetum coccineum]